MKKMLTKGNNSDNAINEQLEENQQPPTQRINNQTFQNEEQELTSISDFQALVPIFGEEEIKKLCSKNTIVKEEGLNAVLNNFDKLVNANETEKYQCSSFLLSLIHKSLSLQGYPQQTIIYLQIFENLSKNSKEVGLTLNSLILEIISKIKDKFGDNNSKLRIKSLEVYSSLFKISFFDPAQVLLDLIDEKNLDIKKAIKSAKITLGKFDILNSIFEEIDNYKVKKKPFQISEIIKFMVKQLQHVNTEVRKLARNLFLRIYAKYGYTTIDAFIKTIDNRELNKLYEELPNLKEDVKKSEESKKNKESEERGKSTERAGDKNSKMCNKCGKKGLENSQQHKDKECLMYISCSKCNKTVEISDYTTHLLKLCSNKKEFTQCKRCKEAIDNVNYQEHSKNNNCNIVKNINAANRCPLCHEDILPFEKGWIKHLEKDKCPNNPRL